MFNKTFNYALGLVICAGLGAQVAVASGKKSDKAPHRDPHVHGHSNLKMASDKNMVNVQLEIPGMDLVGFEYVAKSKEEKKKVEDALALLKNPYNAITLPEAAGCVVDKVKIELAKEEHDHDHDEHDHDKKGKKDDHDHDHDKKKKGKKDDHDHDHDKKKGKKDDGHDHDHEEGEQHNEFHADYAFKCKNVKAIDAVTVNLFSRFPGMKEVEAKAAMANGQFKEELKPKANVFKLK